jgi:hypothetical protein
MVPIVSERVCLIVVPTPETAGCERPVQPRPATYDVLARHCVSVQRSLQYVSERPDRVNCNILRALLPKVPQQ